MTHTNIDTVETVIARKLGAATVRYIKMNWPYAAHDCARLAASWAIKAIEEGNVNA